MPEHHGIYVVICVYVDTAHELDELSRLCLIVAARLVNVFAYKMESHFLTFACFIYEKVSIF